jgi:hypothetical protein
MSNQVIHVKLCHSCQIMSNHVIHVKSCHSCQNMSNHVSHLLFGPFPCKHSVKSGGEGRVGEGRGGEGGQIDLPKLSATASLSGRRQKHVTGSLIPGHSNNRRSRKQTFSASLTIIRSTRFREKSRCFAKIQCRRIFLLSSENMSCCAVEGHVAVLRPGLPGLPRHP